MTDWAKLKVVDLKAELKKRGLPPAGNKADLVARLRDDDDATQGASHQWPDKEDPNHAATFTESLDARQEDSPPVDQDSDSLKEGPTDDPNPPDTTSPPHSSGTRAQLGDEVNTPTDQPETLADRPSGTPNLDTPASADTSQKRKRRSISPSPSSKAKRVRKDDPREVTSEYRSAGEPATAHESSGNVTQDEREKRTDDDVEMANVERVVAPATHPITTALYIKNFMRPLRSAEVEKHLATLATPGSDVDESVVVRFWLDPIRTHAFVEFSTSEAACRVRSALHGAVWPQESNRKELWVDFIPPEHIKEWMDREEGSGGRRGSSVRYEVVYHETDDGVSARLVEAGSDGPSRPPPPSAPQQPPSGPRVHPGVEGAPLAPRAEQQRGRSFRPRLDDPNMRTTRTGPLVYWKPVAEDLARRRIHNMRQFYSEDARITVDDRRNDINRYFFEDGDKFVDRGKEIFAGIRPPHREREHRRMMRMQRERGGDPRVPERDRVRDRYPVSQSFRPSGGDRFTPSSRGYDSYRGRDDRDRGSSYRTDDRRHGGGRDRGTSYRDYRDRRH